MPDPTLPFRFGPFELTELLGKGGMGAVYRARDSSAQRDVALKVNLGAKENESRRKRFEREGQLTAALVHPGIVRIHAAGDEAGRLWIAYELVEEARTLEEAFVDAPLEQRVEWVLQTARAVGFAHLKGVIHRDLKPENILVDSTKRARVADFGLATAQGLDQLTQTGTFLGTPLFMSPEQLGGRTKELTSATDVWSLGVLLYQALTGELPFAGSNLVELKAAAARGWTLSPHKLNAEVTPQLETVCMRALRARASERYADGGAFAADLQRAVAGESPTLLLQTSKVWAAALLLVPALVVALLFLYSTNTGAPSGTGSDAQWASEDGGVLQSVRTSIDAGDLDAALAAARANDGLREFRGRPELAEIRAALFARGLRVAKSAPTQTLLTILDLAAALAPLIDAEPDASYADAVLARALEIERATKTRLADNAVVELVQGVTRAGLRASPAKLLNLLDHVTYFDLWRPQSPEYRLRYYLLLLEQARMDQALLVAHCTELDWPHWKDRPKARDGMGIHEVYLRTVFDVFGPRRSEDDRMRASSRLLALAREESELGPVCRGRGVYYASRTWKLGNRPKKPSEVFEGACRLSPKDPALRLGAAHAYRDHAKQLSARGGNVRAYLEAALRHASEGVRAVEELGFDDVASLVETALALRRLAVGLNAVLGREDAAQAVIDGLPKRAHLRADKQLDALKVARREALQAWRGVLSGAGRETRAARDLGAVDDASLRSYYTERLSGLPNLTRDALTEAFRRVAHGEHWSEVEPPLLRAMKSAGGDERAHVELLRLLIARERFPMATATAKRLLSSGDSVLALEVRLLVAEMAWAQAQLGVAVARFEALAADDPAGIVGSIAAAEGAWLRGEYEASREAAGAALAQDSTHPTANTIMAMALLMNGQVDEAREHLRQTYPCAGALDPRLIGVRAALLLEVPAEPGTVFDTELRRLADEALRMIFGFFDRRIAAQLTLESTSQSARSWGQTEVQRMATDQNDPHTQLLFGLTELMSGDAKSAARRWKRARDLDPRIPIPTRYLKRYEALATPAEVDSFR